MRDVLLVVIPPMRLIIMLNNLAKPLDVAVQVFRQPIAQVPPLRLLQFHRAPFTSRWYTASGTYLFTIRFQPVGPISPFTMLELTSAISRGGIKNTVVML